MTALSDLQGYQSTIDSAWSLVAAPLLAETIGWALGVPAPDGSPDMISEQAAAYLDAGKSCREVTDTLKDVASNKLPAAWRGDVAETAAEAVGALSAESATAAQSLSQAGQALEAWADSLRTAQREDASGRSTLRAAKARLGPLDGWLSSFKEFFDPFDPADFVAAVELARSGIALMVHAASQAQNSAQTTAAALNQLAGQARAERVSASGLDPLDAVVLANELNAASDGGGDIVTAAGLARASQLLNGMSPAQQQEFYELLAGAKSPAEAAYLMKALAAGNSLAAIEKFDALIHPYGDDLDWLSQHLAPDLAGDTYDGASWYHWANLPPGLGYDTYSQGGLSDCVAASTVVATANLDPVYMLKLTTGDEPGVPGADSLTSFENRLHAAYISNYQAGQRADGDPSVYPKVDGGLGSKGENLLANSDLGRATGSGYQYTALNGSGSNLSVLPKVEQAVDAGQPVPLNLFPAGGGDGHQVVIIGASGDKLEVYNPWGSTYWITTQQFVNNNLGSAAPGVSPPLTMAGAIELPSS